MKITIRQAKVFNDAYMEVLNELALDIANNKDCINQVIGQHDFKSFENEQDFIDFGRQACLHNLKRFAEEQYLMEAAKQEADNILRSINPSTPNQ